MADHVATESPEEALRRIRKFTQVFSYLVDDLGWPAERDDLLDDEDLASVIYEWETGQLGIPKDQVRDLRRFQQLRPITTGQPWGVFFLEFAGSRLPRTQVRRLLQALVRRKRSSTATHPTWSLDDLLFVILTGSDDPVELHLLAFSGDNHAIAEFRTLSWCPTHSPHRHLRRLHEELLPHLTWPNDERDVENWRQQWRKAFKLRPGQPITDAKRLVERMADTARDLRDQIRCVLIAEERGGGGHLPNLWERYAPSS
ncbi:hypothetical protein [Candidatus Poriferisocius sp.]|uniref:hypothetical protein n=1 Tax=Candidatus Poriferisocius sp. TaxID=3101276 RepID=UPI003B013D34